MKIKIEIKSVLGKDLSEADLSEADLDYSNWDLSCKTLNVKTDEKFRIQLAFHLLSIIKIGNPTKEEIKIYNSVLEYANKFHRNEIKRLKPIK